MRKYIVLVLFFDLKLLLWLLWVNGCCYLPSFNGLISKSQNTLRFPPRGGQGGDVYSQKNAQISSKNRKSVKIYLTMRVFTSLPSSRRECGVHRSVLCRLYQVFQRSEYASTAESH